MPRAQDCPSHSVPQLHCSHDDLVDVLLRGADAIGHAVNDDLRREEPVSPPLGHILLLAGVPLRRGEGVVPPG